MFCFSRIALALALGVTLAAPAGAYTILIDFEAFAGPPLLGWNTFDATDSGSIVDLLDTTGIDTGIDLDLPTLQNNAGTFDGWNAVNPLPGWAPNAAADDYVYFTTFVTFFTFTGLDPLLTYDFELIVSRDLSRSQDHRMFTGAGNVDIFDWDSQADGYTNGNTLVWTGLTPDAGGTIDLGIRRDDASAALNAIRIVSVHGSPTSLLISVAGLGLGAASVRFRRLPLA